MFNIIPYVKIKEKSIDNRIPLHIHQEPYSDVDNYFEKKEKSIKNNQYVDINVDFTIKNFDIKF